METVTTELPGVLILKPTVYGDERGYFKETWSETAMDDAGLTTGWVQDNESFSAQGTLRGMHFQLLRPQAKLVRVVSGVVLDVAVDIRLGSPTFGKHLAIELSGENHLMLFIPRGFAHGYQVLSGSAFFLYKVDAPYVPDDQHGFRWDDAEVGIPWPNSSPIVNPRDARWPNLYPRPANLLPQYEP